MPSGLVIAGGVTFPLTAPDGSAAAPSYSFANATGAGMYLETGTANLGFAAAGVVIAGLVAGSDFAISSGFSLGFSSSTATGTTADTRLTRLAAASLRLGSNPSAAPVAQTFTVGEASRSGTDSDVGGANGTIRSGLGTGTGTVANLTFQTPTTVGSGSGAQTYTTRLQLDTLGATVTDLVNTSSALTTGTMTKTNSALGRSVWTRFDWTNAMVTALGASLTGDVAVCTLPAKTVVINCYMVIDTQAAGTTTLTGAVGRVSAAYIDYIVASDLKVAANTVYGDASAERGTNLTGYDLPSVTGTTVVNMHFISTVANLSAVTTCTGHIYLETATLP